MSWQVFKARVHYRPRAVTPEVFIRTPRITFNKACTDWLRANRATRINYLFDRDKLMMAVKPAPAKEGYALYYGVGDSQSHSTISAFARWAKIVGGKYPATIGLDMIEIILRAPVAEGESEEK